ncbi:type IV pilin N-terminal domain-containing protein [Methanocorpusculum sp.]|nr:type IV pilin N-terminal domain-containing protein [Methanocorpusculum sp.]MBO5368466.1 type IV pilin N-terminal domain-containing protein [Methanocorpusculum sp.]
MKKDTAVSEVVGTILLFCLVVTAAGIFALFAADIVNEQAETIPSVSIQESASQFYLYHAGGDILRKSDIRIYSQSTDITEKTRINGEPWEFWKTGDLLYLSVLYPADTITVVGRTSAGREVLLFEGLRQ